MINFSISLDPIDKPVNNAPQHAMVSALVGTRTAQGIAMAVTKSARRRLSREARQAELLEHALAVFARRGLERAGHTEIASAAGVAVSTTFVYFPTRVALMQAVLDEVSAFQIALAERAHSTKAPAPERIREHIRAFTEAVDTHPDYARVWLDLSTAIREDVWPHYLEFQDRVLAIIGQTIEQGKRDGTISRDIDVDAAARLIVGSAQMLAQMKFTAFPATRLERFIDLLVSTAVGARGIKGGSLTAVEAERRRQF